MDSSTLWAFWIICGITASVIAASKGRNWFAWLIAGTMFGLFGLLAACCVSRKVKADPPPPPAG